MKGSVIPCLGNNGNGSLQCLPCRLNGTCGSLVANALTIITSYGLRSGMDVGDAIKGLIGHGCHRAPVVDGDGKIMSCVDAIGKAIRLHSGEFETVPE